jgi:sec-independent protein translocase protein TatA
MFGLGFGEILAVGIILFIFFGAKRVPELGSSLAKGIKNFQKGIQGKEDDQQPPKDQLPKE